MASQADNPFERFLNLKDITYGIEIEKFAFTTVNREAFLEEYKALIKLEQQSRVKSQLLLPPRNPDAACLCKIYRKTLNYKQELMQVRLDGEKEFPLLTPDKLTRVSEALFNIEFISSDQGIMKHDDFFREMHKGKNSEPAKILKSFSAAVSQARKNPMGQEVEIEGLVYVFPEWIHKYLVEKPDTMQHRNAKNETLLHITHSLPIVDHPEYFQSLAKAFKGGVAHNFTARQESDDLLVNAFPSKKDIIGDTEAITNSRNAHQPLFKSPRDHFTLEVVDTNQSSYLQDVRRGMVLQPISNRLDFLRQDIEIYKEVFGELQSITQTDASASRAEAKFGTTKEIETLDRTIVKLSEIITLYEAVSPEDASTIRVFESHDEKLQLLYPKTFAEQDLVCHGLLEHRERMELVKYVDLFVLQERGKSADSTQVFKYLEALDKSITIAQTYFDKAVKYGVQDHSHETIKAPLKDALVRKWHSLRDSLSPDKHELRDIASSVSSSKLIRSKSCPSDWDKKGLGR